MNIIVKKNRLIWLLLLFSSLSFSQEKVGLENPISNRDYTEYKKISKFKKLPKKIKKKFRKYNCNKKKIFGKKIYDEIRYEFKFAAINENTCIVFYLHTGRGYHYHSTIFNLKDEQEEINLNISREVYFVKELIAEVEKSRTNISQCNFH